MWHGQVGIHGITKKIFPYYGYTIILYNLCFDSGTLPPTPPSCFKGTRSFQNLLQAPTPRPRPQQLQTLPQRGRLCGLLVHGGWDI